MRCIVKHLVLFLSVFFANHSQTLAETHTFTSLNGITVHNLTQDTRRWVDINGPTKFQAGPNIGNILNVHFFPGLLDYARGNYTSALKEMDYFLERPYYVEMNSQKNKFISHAHCIRGKIYFYHSSGYERYALAKIDFEKAILWDSGNHLAYLELSRVISTIGLKEEASSVLQYLLELAPKEEIAQQARKEISLLNAKEK